MTGAIASCCGGSSCVLGLLFYNLYHCPQCNSTQFDGKADLEFGGGKTQNNEGCRGHTFLCISSAWRKYEGPGGFGEEARPPSVQEFSSSLSLPPRESQQRSVGGTHAFPLLAAVPRQRKKFETRIFGSSRTRRIDVICKIEI